MATAIQSQLPLIQRCWLYIKSVFCRSDESTASVLMQTKRNEPVPCIVGAPSMHEVRTITTNPISARYLCDTPPQLMASFDEGNAVFHVCYGEAYADWMASYLYKWITSRNVSSSIGMSLGRETENLVVHSLTVFAHHPFVTHRNSNVLRAYFDLPSPRIGKTAREAFALIIERSISNQRRVPATVEWIDDTVAVVRYEHPEIEVAEREFSLISLPKGADEGDSFELNVELNVSGRVIGYPSSAGNRLTKRSTEGWEAIMLPKAVQNWNDPVDIARYDSEADAYFARVQQMRANTAIPRPPRPGK